MSWFRLKNGKFGRCSFNPAHLRPSWNFAEEPKIPRKYINVFVNDFVFNKWQVRFYMNMCFALHKILFIFPFKGNENMAIQYILMFCLCIYKNLWHTCGLWTDNGCCCSRSSRSVLWSLLSRHLFKWECKRLLLQKGGGGGGGRWIESQAVKRKSQMSKCIWNGLDSKGFHLIGEKK